MQLFIQGSLNQDELRRQLQALPGFTPPAGGWMRFQRAQLRRRRQRWAGAGGLAMAACLMLAIGIPNLSQQPAEILVQPAPHGVSAMINRSRQLEQRLVSIRPNVSRWSGAQAVQAARIEQGLALVDARLNEARDENTARQLWQRRVQLMQALVDLHQQPSAGPALVQAAYQY